jgi:hypothetical protein
LKLAAAATFCGAATRELASENAILEMGEEIGDEGDDVAS